MAKPRTTKRTTRPAPSETQRGELIYVDPATLVIGKNVRTVADLDEEFLTSIAERGVLQPITAYYGVASASPGENAELIVKEGQRRTLAAVKVGRPEVPVLVLPAPDDAALIIDQLSENDRRATMTSGDRAEALVQLTAFGLTAAQIARTGVASADDVKAAARVAKSSKAQRAIDAHPLTMIQAVVVAEFEDNDNAVSKLLAAASAGRFDHVAQELRDAREREAYRQQLTDQLTETGIPIIEEPSWYTTNAAKVQDLRDRDGNKLDPEQHTTCPGHSAYITSGGYGSKVPYVIGYACADLSANSHYTSDAPKLRSADMTDQEREAAKTQRKDVIESNRLWESAEKVRRAWLQEFFASKTAPKKAARFVAESWARADHELKQALDSGNKLAMRLLAVKAAETQTNRLALTAYIGRASEARAQMISLALVLSAYEERTGKHSWRAKDPATSRYLLFLQDCGYVLADVERRACGLDVAAPPADPEPEPVDPDELDDDDDDTDAQPGQQPVQDPADVDQPDSDIEAATESGEPTDVDPDDALERLYADELTAQAAALVG